VTENVGKVPEAWRNHSTKHPIAASRLRPGDLKRLYKLINDKQIEYRDKFMTFFQLQPNETEDVFDARKKRVYNSFITSMTVHTTTDVMFHGNNESFVEEVNLPDRIRSILFSTSSVPRAILGFDPACRIVLFLDFTTPPLLDFNRLPTLPTPNESNFEIQADNHSWFAASNAVLTEFFDTRKTGLDWLHRAATYDILLIFVGLPISIWAVYRLGQVLERAPKMPSIVSSAIYIYAFFFSLNIFRMLFSYSRWVFPKVELETRSSSSPLRHRSAWLAIMGPLVVAFLYDVAKTLFTN
jgi:hypothetical protein